MLQLALLEYPTIRLLKVIIRGRWEYSKFTPYIGRDKFTTYMDLKSLDIVLFNFPIHTIFESKIFTIILTSTFFL